jgi:hypothetical protein
MSRAVLWAAISWSQAGSHSQMTPLSQAIEVAMPGLIQRIEAKHVESRLRLRIGSRIRRLLGPRPVPGWHVINGESPFYRESSWMLEHEISNMISELHPPAVVLESIEDQFFG